MRSPTGEVIFHESEPVYQRRGVLKERIDQPVLVGRPKRPAYNLNSNGLGVVRMLFEFIH
jgi:hypothetical protein